MIRVKNVAGSNRCLAAGRSIGNKVASVVVEPTPTLSLPLAAPLLLLDPPLLRGARRLRRHPFLRNDQRFRHERRKALLGERPVLELAARVAGGDTDSTLSVET
jgi:hypothetical protein